MATRIESFQDILDLLEQNPEYREAMRRYILDEEFRRLPADVRELRESIVSLAQTVREYVAATDARLGRLEDGQAELKADVTELKAGQTRMQGQLNNLTGTDYERKVVKLATRAVRRYFDIRNAQLIHSITNLDNFHLANLLEQATDTSTISDDQADDLVRSDLILLGQTPAGEPAYAVAEVSVTIDENDVDRAVQRARILQTASGVGTQAAVIGTVISDANRQRANAVGVTFIAIDE